MFDRFDLQTGACCALFAVGVVVAFYYKRQRRFHDYHRSLFHGRRLEAQRKGLFSDFHRGRHQESLRVPITSIRLYARKLFSPSTSSPSTAAVNTAYDVNNQVDVFSESDRMQTTQTPLGREESQEMISEETEEDRARASHPPTGHLGPSSEDNASMLKKMCEEEGWELVEGAT